MRSSNIVVLWLRQAALIVHIVGNVERSVFISLTGLRRL